MKKDEVKFVTGARGTGRLKRIPKGSPMLTKDGTPVHKLRYQKNGVLKVDPRVLPPLEECLTAILLDKDNEDGVEAINLILGKLRQMAIAGNIRAAEVLLERAYGKVKQEMKIDSTSKQFIVIAGQHIDF